VTIRAKQNDPVSGKKKIGKEGVKKETPGKQGQKCNWGKDCKGSSHRLKGRGERCPRG